MAATRTASLTRVYESSVSLHSVSARFLSFPWPQPPWTAEVEADPTRLPVDVDQLLSAELLTAGIAGMTMPWREGMQIQPKSLPFTPAWSPISDRQEFLATAPFMEGPDRVAVAGWDEQLPEVSWEAAVVVLEILGADVIPVEFSPLSGTSLAELLGRQEVGAVLGMAAAHDESLWLLFLAAPFGMVVYGAAKGVAAALEVGLRERSC